MPIWADPDLPDLARCIRSGSVLAAVRSATPGTTQDASAAAPYRSGPWLFSHNGAVPDWPRLPAHTGAALDPAILLGLEARCDSALLWAMVLTRLRQGEPPGTALAAVARQTMDARPSARVNLLLTDGRTIAATRCGDSLWYRAGAGVVLVASEPSATAVADGSGPQWQEVPAQSVLLATRSSVNIIPLPMTAPKPHSGRTPAPAPAPQPEVGSPPASAPQSAPAPTPAPAPPSGTTPAPALAPTPAPAPAPPHALSPDPALEPAPYTAQNPPRSTAASIATTATDATATATDATATAADAAATTDPTFTAAVTPAIPVTDAPTTVTNATAPTTERCRTHDAHHQSGTAD